MESTKLLARAAGVTRARLAAVATSCLLAAAGCGSGGEVGTVSDPDGGSDAATCFTCDEGLALALMEQSGISALLCPGAAATAWAALDACRHDGCQSTCAPAPFADCLVCLEGPDSAGGCRTELAACENH